MKQEWYIRVMGDELGPYSFDEVEEMTKKGAVAGDTPIRKGREGTWISASDIHTLPAVRRPILTTLQEVGDAAVPPVSKSAKKMAIGTEARRAVSGPSRAGKQDFDEVFFDEGGVRVTRTRFIVAGQTYALTAITSVRQGHYVIPGARGSLLIMLVVGGCMLVGGLLSFLSSITSPDGTLEGGVVGFLLAGSGGIIGGSAYHMLGSIVDTQVHFVAIMTAAGEQTVCQSQNLTFVSSIVQALNDAIVARG